MAKVFITGIAGGFGRPTALALLARGHDVAGSVRTRAGRNAATVADLEAAGARIVQMDVTDTPSTEAGVAQAIAALGGGWTFSSTTPGSAPMVSRNCCRPRIWRESST